jgi:hypothetical protein
MSVMTVADEAQNRTPTWAVDERGRIIIDSCSLLEALEHITRAGRATPGLDGLLAALHEATVPFGVLGVVAWTRHDDHMLVAGAAGYDDATLARFAMLPLTANLPCSDAVVTRRTVACGDRADMFAAYPLIERLVGRTESLAALPLEYDGEVVGGLSLHFRWPMAFGAGTLAFLASVTNLLAPHCHRTEVLADVVPLAVVQGERTHTHDDWDSDIEHPPGSMLSRLEALERQMRKMRQLMQFMGAIANDRLDEGG